MSTSKQNQTTLKKKKRKERIIAREEFSSKAKGMAERSWTQIPGANFWDRRQNK